jgi:hypothetical protein
LELLAWNVNLAVSGGIKGADVGSSQHDVASAHQVNV